ncbi:MSMEG_1061 family FMN-dependent PPOX-type flavoprotein [uncultured Streptomyces sp.]|uniref:MSMEG_1061 family FMN-dependent PPOX-type flavoprotein n=1 Tax=uncultured Streptomyces sp. TaxID=174707 RepID=UPI00263736F9|nr:MSMEG_1061 family FMN-dependent PPOX-type flavoprotein [uncultured Streptomyces sp.]
MEIGSADEFAELLGTPHPIVIDKVHPTLTEDDVALIRQSPFCAVATSDDLGNCDTSPRGGAPGFAHVLDERTLVLPDMPGNRRSDSFRNVLRNPHVGLLFLIPGAMTVLRVNGRARVLRDAPFFADLATEAGKRPKLALVVEIDEIFLHCPASLTRSRLWQPESWSVEPKAPKARRARD